jgi:CheY-like chemotaxis protein
VNSLMRNEISYESFGYYPIARGRLPGVSSVVRKRTQMKSIESTVRPRPGVVLIVDDDLDDIRFTRRVIASVCPHLVVRDVQSGQEMIRYLVGQKEFSNRRDYPYPTLVLLDLKMPGMDGFDVLLWLGSHPPHSLIPVVVLTVAGQVPLAQYAYQLGARSFLTKPLTADEFENTISEFKEFLEQVR